MPSTAILSDSDYGLAEAAILSQRLLSATTLPDVLARPAIVTAAVAQPSPALRRVVIKRRGLDLHVKVYADQPMSSALSTSVEAVADLLSLPKGWNSYAAKPIAPQNVVRAIRLLVELLVVPQTPAPAVVPRVQGGIQFEWHTKSIDVEVYIDSPGEVSFFAEDAESGQSVEGTLPGQEHVLKAWVQRISGK